MFRTSVARQARLARLSSSLCTLQLSAASFGARLCQSRLASSDLLQPSRLGSPCLAQTWRLYSSAVEAREEVSESAAPGPITKFADLSRLGVDPSIVQSITEGMRYENMTDVQSATINPALEGKDMVAQAKTGTGKTLAFLVPVLQRILASDPELVYRRRNAPVDIRAMIISPTRELAEQIAKEAQKLCARNGVKVQLAVGGTRKKEALRQLHYQGCNILVGTPGRLNDLLSDPSSGVTAPKLSALVLDEADRMLDVGFERELRDIVDLLPDRRQVPRQTLMFSATLPDNVVNLARSYVDRSNFKFVQTIKPDEVATHEKVPQFIVPVQRYENMLPATLEMVLRELEACQKDPLRDPFKAIMFFPFTTLTHMAANLFLQLARSLPQMPEIYYIHSKLTQSQRTRAAENFRRAKSAILVSSDVTARGMDFPNVTHVIQFGMPPEREQYIHRLGRTGRADKAGEGWLFVPQFSMDAARRMLGGLPIKRRQDLETAAVTSAPTSLEEAHPTYKMVAEQLRCMPKGLLADVYHVHFGKAERRSLTSLVAELNEWVRHAWGWDAPPAMTQSAATKKGLVHVPGINIGTPSREEAFFDLEDYNANGMSGGRGRRGDFGRGGDRGDFFGRGEDRGGFGRGGFDRRDSGRGGSRGGFSRGGDRGDFGHKNASF